MFSKIKEVESKLYNDEKKTNPPSVVSCDLSMTGDIVSTGEIHVDGRVRGDIRCRTLVVGVNAEIVGSVQADFVKIYGCLEGQVYARSVFLSGSARVTGDITHESLEMEAGAFLDGHCRHTDDPIPAEQAPAELMLTDATAQKDGEKK